MHNSYYLFLNKTFKFELINKNYYSILTELPKIKKIVLSFKLNVFSLKMLAIHFLILQNIVEAKKGTIIRAKKANILIKIKKGNPVGCKISLTNNKKISLFLKKLFYEVFVLKSSSTSINDNCFSTKFDDIFLVSKENFFNNFTSIKKQKLSVVIYYAAKKSEIAYIFKNIR
jgi:ribosomal protein L5